MQGAEIIDVRFDEGNNVLYVLGTSPAAQTFITSLGGNDTFHFGYDVSQQPRKVVDVLGLITINAGSGTDRMYFDDRFYTNVRAGAMTDSVITGFGNRLVTYLSGD